MFTNYTTLAMIQVIGFTILIGGITYLIGYKRRSLAVRPTTIPRATDAAYIAIFDLSTQPDALRVYLMNLLGLTHMDNLRSLHQASITFIVPRFATTRYIRAVGQSIEVVPARRGEIDQIPRDILLKETMRATRGIVDGIIAGFLVRIVEVSLNAHLVVTSEADWSQRNGGKAKVIREGIKRRGVMRDELVSSDQCDTFAGTDHSVYGFCQSRSSHARREGNCYI